MFVNDCKIECTLSGENPEGFSSMVSKELAKEDGTPGEVILRGPFKTILEAQKYAHAWHDALNPPMIPVEVSTASTNFAVTVPRPIEQPPIIEKPAEEK